MLTATLKHRKKKWNLVYFRALLVILVVHVAAVGVIFVDKKNSSSKDSTPKNDPEVTTYTQPTEKSNSATIDKSAENEKEISAQRSKSATIVNGIGKTQYAINDGNIIKFNAEGQTTITIDAYLSDVNIAVTADKQTAENMLSEPVKNRDLSPSQALIAAKWLEANLSKFEPAGLQQGR